MADFRTIALEHRDGVSTITLNRPPLNLVVPDMLAELVAAFDLLEARSQTRCIVLTGAGERAFCAGADIGDEESHTPEEGRKFRDAGRAVVERIEACPKPVIAGIRGWCIGGGTGLAWPCDIRVAAESARFRAGDVYLGIIPTWSVGLVRLVHYIGRNRTLDVLLLGEDLSASQALELGIVSKVVPDASFDSELARVADRLASGAPMAIAAIKQAVRAQYQQSTARAAELEEESAMAILASEDAHEGMAAFQEKRKAAFKGR